MELKLKTHLLKEKLKAHGSLRSPRPMEESHLELSSWSQRSWGAPAEFARTRPHLHAGQTPPSACTSIPVETRGRQTETYQIILNNWKQSLHVCVHMWRCGLSDQSGRGVRAGAADHHQVSLDSQQFPAAIKLGRRIREVWRGGNKDGGEEGERRDEE